MMVKVCSQACKRDWEELPVEGGHVEEVHSMTTLPPDHSPSSAVPTEAASPDDAPPKDEPEEEPKKEELKEEEFKDESGG
eukprot:7059150-Karenia_brevis.AAC.1